MGEKAGDWGLRIGDWGLSVRLCLYIFYTGRKSHHARASHTSIATHLHRRRSQPESTCNLSVRSQRAHSSSQKRRTLVIPRPSFLPSLNSAGSLEQVGQLTLLGLQIRVAADVLLVDEDVGHSALARQFGERILDISAIVCPPPLPDVSDSLPRMGENGIDGVTVHNVPIWSSSST